jgi:phospholipase C
MQENHSFDNYFGYYPGADGIPDGVCMPVDPDQPGGECVLPWHVGDTAVEDLGHNEDVFDNQFNNGKMDGFISAIRRSGSQSTSSMGYYDGDDIGYYWNIAHDFVLFDRMFTSAAGGSVWNHMFWIAGVKGAEVDGIPDEGFGDIQTIFDRLEAKGISWKFYVQNYDPSVTFRTRGTGDKASQIVWAPVLGFARFIDDPELFSHIVPLDQYYTDLNNGTLPSVAYMVPSGASEHPPGSIRAGVRFVRGLINALQASSSWDSSAFMWSYDDWGGYYDHVVPPQVDDVGYGFRAPALLVSAYAKQGYIDHTELDFTSGLKFIEENWGVASLAERDANANNFLDAFDFSQPPRAPILLSDVRNPPPVPKTKTGLIYATYAAAVGMAIVVLVATLSAGKRRRVSPAGGTA